MPIIVSIAFLALIGFAALFAPALAPHDPIVPSFGDRNRPPIGMEGGGTNHLLGTDNIGHDILSRLLYGARVSLGIGLLAALIGTVLGSVLGIVAGYFKGLPEWLLMLAVDAQLATPFLVVAIAVVAVVGKSIPVLIALAGFSGWPLFARACRASVMSLRGREFVVAARALGASDGRILARHILPNLGATILVIATIDLRRVILFEASVSFLGLGVQPPQPSWGSMVERGREYLNTAWWIAVVPGMALMTTILALSLVGDWVRDALDPTLRSK